MIPPPGSLRDASFPRSSLGFICWTYFLPVTTRLGGVLVRSIACYFGGRRSMGEEESTKMEVEGVAGTAAHPPPAETVKDLAKDKSAVPPPEEEEKPDDSKSLATVDTTEAAATKKTSGGSIDRDAVLARVETEKRESMIKAWEENEKTKAQNKAAKKMASITAWENSKMAALEAELKMKEEALEKKKAEYVEKMKNKIAMLHKAAEEKKAMVEAKRGEEFLKAEEMAAKYRVTGFTPKKLFGCFGA